MNVNLLVYNNFLTEDIKSTLSNIGTALSHLNNITRTTQNFKDTVTKSTENIRDGMKSSTGNIRDGVTKGTENIRDGIKSGAKHLSKGIIIGTGIIGASHAIPKIYKSYMNSKKKENIKPSFFEKNKKDLAIGGGAALGVTGAALATRALLKHLRKKRKINE